MRRKDAGFVEKMLPVLLSTGMVFGLILLSGRFTEVIRTREEMNQIARAYLLEMETGGYLPNDRILSLENKLKDCGLTEISFAGTTLTEVDYGESIQLSVSGNLKVNLNVAIPFLYKKQENWNIPIHISMASTAKH